MNAAKHARALLLLSAALAACGGKVIVDLPETGGAGGNGGTGGIGGWGGGIGGNTTWSTSTTWTTSSWTTSTTWTTSTWPPTCGFSWPGGPDGCQSCMEGSCCDILSFCEQNPNCDYCLKHDMKGPGCNQSGEIMKAWDCINGACQGSCQGICNTGLSTQQMGCDNCLGTFCCAQLSACMNDQLCFDCLTGQQTQGCEQSQLLMETGTCFQNNCTQVCGL